LVIAMAAAMAVTLAMPPMVTTVEAGFFINDAVAASDHGSGGHQGQGQKGQKGGGAGQVGKAGQGKRQGKKSVADLLSEDEGEEDSDRPPWAGQSGREGKPGAGSHGGNTKKGGDYGDIVVMLRYDDGTLVQDGNTTYAVAPDGTLIPVVNGEIPEGADVQAVEFGRLNIARAPSKVLEHSLVELLSKLDGGILYDSVTLDPAGRLVVDGSTIDSPLENLALYEALLTTPAVDGVITLTASSSHDGADTTYSFSVPEDARLDLAASAIAAASDKTGELTIDEIVGISSFIGVSDELASYIPSFTYDRVDTYTDVNVWVLEPQPDGSYLPVEKELLTAVDWNTVEDNSIKENTDGGIDVFTQAADDAVQAIEYVHDFALDQ
jgi:hypothetical protein